MKTALEWLFEVGETVGQDIFCNEHQKPGDKTLAIIKKIQVDAIQDCINTASNGHMMYSDMEKAYRSKLTRESYVNDLIASLRRQITELSKTES